MGYSISWLCVKKKSKSKILSTLGLLDTGRPDEANESLLSGAQLPGGWYLVFINELVHPLNGQLMLSILSEDCEVVVCRVEEHVMASAAFAYANGTKVWDVTHDSEKGIYHLSVEGTPPAIFEKIRADKAASQDSEGGEDAGVDYIFDVPVALAAALCGYRHDRVMLASGEKPTFSILGSTV